MSTLNPPPPVTPPFLSPPPFTVPVRHAVEKEITLRDLWHILMREKGVIVVVTVFWTAVAVLYALIQQPVYRAEVLLQPVTEEGQQGGGLLAQYGGLAAMAGLNTGGGSNSKDANVATLESRLFVGAFLHDTQLLPVLFHDRWDAEAKRWKEGDPGKVPTLWEGVTYFGKEVLRVSEDKKTGLITLAIEWYDREQAAHWANLLVQRINEHLRTFAIQDAEKSMAYLQTELGKATVVELQQAIANLLEGQIKKIMLTRVRTDFAFKVIDPAVVAPEQGFVRPRRRVIAVLGCVLGGFLGVCVAFLRNFLRIQKA